MGLKELKTIDNDSYVRLCYYCHKSVHWCMEVLNISWKEISNIQNSR